MAHEFRMLVNGELVTGSGSFDVVNPASGAAFAQCPKADLALLNSAVAAAKAAFPGWAATPIDSRAALVSKLAEALEPRIDEFARLLTQEQGKPLPMAKGEILGTIHALKSFAAMRPENKVLRENERGKIIEHRKPLGVVAAITPWNFPLMLFAQKLAPALVAGNTIVGKPAPTTPLTSLLFGEICAEVLPKGVVNIICDQNDLGGALTSHPDVDKVSFTGSTATGKKVMQSASDSVKRFSLELGGNDAAIVLDDVDPVQVAGKVFRNAMMNSGQVCVAIKRAYVPQAMYDPFCDELARLAGESVVGDGLEQGTTLGPIQNAMQFEKVKGFLDSAHADGKVIAGGAPLDRPGYFIPPTIVRDIPRGAKLVREEQFGPVLPVLAYSDLDEAIADANDSDMGLGGSVWGNDLDRATEVAMRIDAGTVWINQHLALDNAIPFRGAKQSGFGGELGQEGLHEFTQPHVINAVSLG